MATTCRETRVLTGYPSKMPGKRLEYSPVTSDLGYVTGRVEIGLGRLLLVVQRGAPYCGEDGLGICTVASRIRVVSTYWVGLGIDERLFAANTVAREFFRHINVDDVDIWGLVSSGDCLLDGGVEEFDCVIDLSFEVSAGIPWENLEQVGIASHYDECVRRRICHRDVETCEIGRERLQLTKCGEDGIRAAVWGDGGTRGKQCRE